MYPIILYRDSEFTFNRKEVVAMKKYFRTTPNRATIKPNDLVIGRLSVLPYYRETHDDIAIMGGKLINGTHHHGYLANLAYWYRDLEEITPKTWFWWADIPHDDIPLVLKGETNSRKSMWKTHMFAKDKNEASTVMSRLLDDHFISQQNIVFREYVPLKTYCHGLNGQPITDEYRFFIYKKEVVAGGFYWSSHVDEINENGIFPDHKNVPREFLDKVISKVQYDDMFYVADVAQTENGNWILIELNDACMSGLSCIDPDTLYLNLKNLLEKEGHSANSSG